MIPSLLAAIVACAPIATVPAAGDPPADAPVARLDGRVLSRGDFGAWLVERYGMAYLDEFVGERAILRAAEDEGVVPSQAEIDAAYQAEVARILKEHHHGDPRAYEADIRRRGYEPATWIALQHARLRMELVADALARSAREVDEALVAARFADKFGRTGTDEGEHVVLDVVHFNMYAGLDLQGPRPDVASLKAAARQRAARAAEALASGAPLADVAPLGDPIPSDFVVDGRVDPYRRLLLGPEVERALTSLDEPGDVSAPVAVYDGFYVVRLVERRPVTLAETRSALEAELRAAPATSAEVIAARERALERYDAEVLLR